MAETGTKNQFKRWEWREQELQEGVWAVSTVRDGDERKGCVSCPVKQHRSLFRWRISVLLPTLDKKGNAQSSLLPWKLNLKNPLSLKGKVFTWSSLSSQCWVCGHESLHKIRSTFMVLLMEIKLKVQLNTARGQERREIIILDFPCFLTDNKECTEIINNLPKSVY